jgi:hypothetical protein
MFYHIRSAKRQVQAEADAVNNGLTLPILYGNDSIADDKDRAQLYDRAEQFLKCATWALFLAVVALGLSMIIAIACSTGEANNADPAPTTAAPPNP